MTAFGRAAGELLEWEIKSVNHRFLELGFRLPEPLKGLERPLRDRATGRLRRGKVEASLRLTGAAAPTPRVNGAALRKLLGAAAEARAQAPDATLDVVELMRWPGVLEDDRDDIAQLKAAALAAYGEALDDLCAHRESEGAGLQALLRERLAAAEDRAKEIRRLADRQASVLRGRLSGRLRELLESPAAEPGRIEQEVALLAQKADMAEELDRLALHVAAARASLEADEPCGRRLDFLLQEMYREANTVAAKAALPEIAPLAVDLKVAIEQMREQAQNVE